MSLSPPAPPSEPRLSVAVVVGRQRTRARQCLAAIGDQTRRDELELLVVDLASESDAGPLDLPEGVETRVLELGTRIDLREARARAFTEARAPLIAFCEDHAMVREDWADAILRYAEAEVPGRDWAAASFAFANANPGSYMSTASFIADYLEWAHPVPDDRGRPACNNVVYHRPTVLSLGDELSRYLGSDVLLFEHLRTSGLRTTVIRDAVLYHQNPESLGVLLKANLAHCRLIAAGRVRTQSFSWPRRVLYAVAAPLYVTPLKAVRLLRAAFPRRSLWLDVLRTLPVSLLVFLLSSVAEGIGYVAGSGDAKEEFKEAELSATRSERFERGA